MTSPGHAEGSTAGASSTAPTPLVGAPAAWTAVAVVVAAHLAALVLADPAPAPLLAGEGALLVLVAGLEVGLGRGSARTVAVLGVCWGALVGGTVLASPGTSLPLLAAALAVAVALATYGLHRYELVALGLVETEAEEAAGVTDERE